MKPRFENWQSPEMEHGKPTKWFWIPYFPENIKIGKMVDIGALCYLHGKKGIEIGNYTQIGSHTSIYSVNSINQTEGKVIIGKHVCIGTHSTILPKVRIGDNAFIGAYSLITKNVVANKNIPAFTKW